MRPTLFGYLVIQTGMTADDAAQLRAALTAFAEREGYSLEHIFEEMTPATHALAAVIDITLEQGAAGVLVSRRSDLGEIHRTQELARQRIERETGVRVIVMEPDR